MQEKPKKTITPDYIRAKLKQCWTMKDFCEDLGISEASLSEFIEKHSNNRVYASFPQRIKQNEQLAKKRQRSEEKKLTESNPSTPSEPKVEPKVTPTPEKKDNSGSSSSNPPEEQIEVDPIDAEIESLYQKIKYKEHNLANRIKLITQLSNEKDDLNISIAKMQNKVGKLSRELEVEKQNLAKATQRITEIATKISSYEQNISEFDSEIADYKSKIRELKKITILVSESDILPDKNVKIPDSWNEKYLKLLEDSLVENLTIKQIQQLAKLLVLFEKLKKDDAYFEFIFEIESTPGKDSVKTLFELFTEKH